MPLKFLTFALALFCTSCGKEKSTEPIPLQTKKAQTATKTVADTTTLFVPFAATLQEYLKAKNGYIEVVDTTLTISKIDGKIILPLKKNRPPVVFKDSLHPEYDEDIKEYRYIGHIDNPAFYLIEGLFWEWNECYLINQYTGRKDTLWTMPVFSPDKKMMVNLSPGYGLEGNPNGFQLWQISNNNGNATINKLKEVDQQEWIPLDIFWEDSCTLIFKAVTVDVFMKVNGEPKEKDVYYFRIKVSR